jgi:transcriptional regulator with XRE-family HTH domain
MDKDLIRHCRQLANLTQRELADKLNYSHTYICKVENGSKKVSPALKTKLFKVFEAEGIDISRIALIQTWITNRN